MHYLDYLCASVDETHLGLGKISVIACLAAKARVPLLIVAPSGTGKSTVEMVVKQVIGDTVDIDATTLNGLIAFQSRLDGSHSTIIVDDLGKVDTMYSRLATMVTFSDLAYSHSISKHAHAFHLEINNFNGSVLMAIQPVILRDIVRQPQWEANIQDKLLRYYHLLRPTVPNITAPLVQQPKMRDLETVKLSSSLKLDSIVSILLIQCSITRAIEHSVALVKACAALDNRQSVSEDDIQLVFRNISGMGLEAWLLRRAGFEEKRVLDTALIYLLIQWVTYRQFTLQQVMSDYKLSQSSAYKLMERYKKLWMLSSKSPTVYIPSDRPLFSGEKTSMLDIVREARGDV